MKTYAHTNQPTNIIFFDNGALFGGGAGLGAEGKEYDRRRAQAFACMHACSCAPLMTAGWLAVRVTPRALASRRAGRKVARTTTAATVVVPAGTRVLFYVFFFRTLELLSICLLPCRLFPFSVPCDFRILYCTVQILLQSSKVTNHETHEAEIDVVSRVVGVGLASSETLQSGWVLASLLYL